MNDIPSDKYEEIIGRLKEICKLLQLKQKHPKEIFLDNYEFIKTMNISQRTAQSWREKGLIGYSKVENKIYYKMSEILNMLDKHYFTAKK